jgi:hypothetical protein
MWIEFYSKTPAQELAEYLAPFIYPPPSDSVHSEAPSFGKSSHGNWWELSMSNDHKLDVRPEVDDQGRRRYTYRDRYRPEERMLRIEQALRDHPDVPSETIKRI